MAITAKFQADFTGFSEAVARADEELKKLGISAAGTAKSLDKMVSDFSGAKVISDATLMAEAVEHVGGASKLTEAELQKVAGRAAEAATKLKALGVEVPPKIKDLADQFHPVPTLLERIGEKAGAAVGGFLAFETIKTVFVDLVKGTIEFASHLDDLSKATGINTTTLQELGFAGKRVGLTMEDIGTAAGQLSKRLATGDASATKAVQALGLNIKELQSLSPDQAFIKIAESVGKISNPLQQAGVGSELFGKQFQNVLRLANDGLKETMAQAEATGAVLDKSTIKTLDDFGDAVGDLTTRLKVLAAEALGPAVGWLNQMLGIAKDVSHQTFIDPKDEENFKKFGVAVGAANVNLDGLGPKLTIAGKAAEDLAKGNSTAITATDLINNRLKALKDGALEPLTTAQEKQITALNTWGESTKEIAELVGVTEQRVHVFLQAMKDTAAETKKAADEQARFLASVKNLAVGMIPATNGLRGFGTLMPDLSDRSGKFREGLDDLDSSFNEVHDGVTIMGDRLSTVLIPAFGTAAKVTAQFADALDEAHRKAAESHSVFGDLGTSLQGLLKGFTGGNGISGLFENVGKGAIDQVGRLITGGITSLIGAGISGIGSLFGKLFGNPEKEINPIREAFVQAAGGLDTLNQKAAAAGVTLDAMLNAKNPEQYTKAINDLNAALGLSDQAMKAADDTVQKFGLTVDQLGPKFKQQKLDEQAASLVNDYKLLDAVVADHATTLDKLAPSVNAYIATILKAGGTIPQELKDPIEQMRKLGLLTDDSGKAFTDAQLDGLTFATTLDAKFTTLLDGIQKLVDALTKQLGPAIDNLPSEHTVHIGYQVDAPPNADFGGDRGIIAAANGFEGMVTRPTLFLAGEAGAEHVSIGSGGGGGVREAIEALHQDIKQFPRMIRDAMILAT